MSHIADSPINRFSGAFYPYPANKSYPGTEEAHTNPTCASEGSASEPSLARRVSMC